MEENSRDVFISYHTDSCKEIAERIANVIENSGTLCWYAPRDCISDYPHEIVKAIRNCKIFLLILNEKSNISEHCLNEVGIAFERFKNHEDIILIPFRIDECLLSDDMYYFLCRIHVMNGSLPPEVQRVKELVNRIMTLLGKKPEYEGTALNENEENSCQTYKLIGNIVYPDSKFIGRKDELDLIEKSLNGSTNKLFLVGFGGIGKSEIAKMYLSKHQEDYKVVLWVPFEKSLEQTIINDYSLTIEGISRTDYPDDTDKDYMHRKIKILKQIADKDVLIVIDNFDITNDPDLEEFVSGKYTVLFTTRNHQEKSFIPEISIKQMQDENELLELFKLEYKKELTEEGLKIVKNILELVNGHTLTIRLIASAMQSHRISPEKMLDILKNSNKNSIQTTDLIYGRLKSVFDFSNLNETEVEILKNLSLISLDGIEVEKFYEWCGFEDYNIIDELISKNWIIHDPVSDKVHLHPLIGELMQEKLDGNPKNCNTLINSIINYCAIWHNWSFTVKTKNAEMVEYLVEHLPKSNSLYNTIRFTNALGYAHTSQNEKAISEYEYLFENAKNNNEKIRACERLAQRYYLSDEPEKGFKIALKGYDLFKNLDEKDWPEGAKQYCAKLIGRLGECKSKIGEFEEACKYLKMSRDVVGKYYTINPEADIAWADCHLADAYFRMGNLEQCEETVNDGLKALNDKDDKYAHSYLNVILSKVYLERGSFEKALELNQYSIDNLSLIDGELNVGPQYEDRGDIFAKMHDVKNAEECYNIAKEKYIKKNLTKKIEEINSKLEKI